MDQLHSNSVLLVEDDELVASSIANVMRSRGVTIHVFKSAEEFIQQFTSQPQGTLILDIVLGSEKLSGIDLLRWIRSKNWTIPVIILSGQVTIPQAVEAMRESVIDIISKPPSVQRLVAAVQDSFDRSSSKIEQSAVALTKVLESLTQTERSILELLLSGASNKLVASRLDLGLRSAVRYRRTLLEAFGFGTITELANALGAAGIGPTQISVPSVFAPTIPAQQRKEIRDRIDIVIKLLRDADRSNIESLQKIVGVSSDELEKLAGHPHLATAPKGEWQASVILISDSSQVGSLLRDLIRAYGLFCERCQSIEDASQYFRDCSDGPPTFVIGIESEAVTLERIQKMEFCSDENSRTKVLFIGKDENDAKASSSKTTVWPGPVRGLALVQFLMEQLQKPG